MRMADHLPRAALPVAGDGQIDLSCIGNHDTEHNRVIGFAHLALLELATDVGVGELVQGDYHDSRRVQVQPVHDTRGRVALLQPRDQAVLVQGVAAGDTEQQVGFAYQQQIVVLVENRDFLCAVRDEIGWGFLHGAQLITTAAGNHALCSVGVSSAIGLQRINFVHCAPRQPLETPHA